MTYIDPIFYFKDLLIFLIILLVVNLVTQNIFKSEFAESLPLTISFIVIILYVFGILNSIKWGTYFIVGCSLTYLILFYKVSMSKIKKIISPQITIFLSWILFYFLMYGDVTVNFHDDLNYWGLTIKNMFMLDDFAVGIKANNGYQDYPPAFSLFINFFLNINGEASESVYFFRQITLGFCIYSLSQ